MALVGVEGGGKKPAHALPRNPTMVDQAALDLAYSNVAAGPLREDEQAAYDPVTGTVRATPIDDLPRPPAIYPTVPKPPVVDLRTRLQAIVNKSASLKPGPGLTTLSEGYGVSANIEDRRGEAPVRLPDFETRGAEAQGDQKKAPLAPKMIADLNRLIGQKR